MNIYTFIMRLLETTEQVQQACGVGLVYDCLKDHAALASVIVQQH